MAALKQSDFSSYAFWCFTLSIALLPIGLGGDRPFPLGLAQAGLSLSCLFLYLSPKCWHQLYFGKRLHYALGMLAVVCLWALIQTQPFVPENWAHPLWQSAASVLTRPIHGSISVVPEDSLNGLSRLMTYIAAGFLAYVLGQDPQRARQLVKAIWLTGTVICIYGLGIHVSGLNMILWFTKWAYVGELTATFVNHNHFAIYAGIVLVSGAALLAQTWREDVQHRKPHQRIEALRSWLVKQAVPRTFLLVVVLICILLSDSRAGFVWSLIGLGSYFFFHQIYLHAWGRALAVGLVMVLILLAVAVVVVSFSEHFSVLFNDYSSTSRSQVYELTWRAIKDNPWLGYGLGGFEPEFRLYQQNMVYEFSRAHSDVLESLLDLGIPVGLMLWTAIALMLSGLWHGIRHRRQNGMFATLALAVSLMVLGHALVDFDLQIPGVTLTWAALLGTGLAQSWNRVQKQAARPE
jgi:O-antigen ligase